MLVVQKLLTFSDIQCTKVKISLNTVYYKLKVEKRLTTQIISITM